MLAGLCCRDERETGVKGGAVTRGLTLAAMVVLLAATWWGWMWVWGLFFLYWAVMGLVTGDAFVVVPLRRADDPFLFWLISAMWLALAVLTVAGGLIGLGG